MSTNFNLNEYTDMRKYADKVSRSGLEKFEPLVITCAITGALQGAEANPNLPEYPEDQIRSATEAYNAGASMVHIHARDPKNPQEMTTSYEDYLRVNIGIRENCPDLIINNTAMGGRYFSAEKGAYGWARESLPARPEVASLDTDQLVQLRHRKARPDPLVGRKQDEFEDFFCLMRPFEGAATVEEMRKYGVKPEFELFGTGSVSLAKAVIKEANLEGPHWFSVIFGGLLGMSPSIDSMLMISRMLPENSVMNIIGAGAAQWAMVTAGILLGHHVRVGLEDNYFYSKGRLAKSNAEMVERVVQIAQALGRPIATPTQAREILGIGEPRQYSWDYKPL